MLDSIEKFLRDTYEWTFSLSPLGELIWGIYLFGSLAIGAVAAFSAFYWQSVNEDPPFYLSPTIIIGFLFALFFVVGIVGRLIY